MKKIFLLLLVLVTSSFVFSQEAEEGFDEDSIENVVTTALLKEETVQDASVAVTVLTGDDIDERGISCLLYTSPSPRDLWISRMPSSA